MPPRGELRGVWITRFAYNSRAQLEGIIDRAAGQPLQRGVRPGAGQRRRLLPIGPRAVGTVVFASTYLDAEPTRWDAFRGTGQAPGPYIELIDPPPMPWKP